VLNPFLLFAKMDIFRFSSQQAKKDGRRFYPTELLSRETPSGYEPERGNFFTL